MVSIFYPSGLHQALHRLEDTTVNDAAHYDAAKDVEAALSREPSLDALGSYCRSRLRNSLGVIAETTDCPDLSDLCRSLLKRLPKRRCRGGGPELEPARADADLRRWSGATRLRKRKQRLLHPRGVRVTHKRLCTDSSPAMFLSAACLGVESAESAKPEMHLNPIGMLAQIYPSRHARAKKGWTPGVDVGHWIGRGAGRYRHVSAQLRVVLVNASKQLERLSLQCKRGMLRCLGGAVGASTGNVSLATQLLSALTRINCLTIRNTVADVARAGYDPSANVARVVPESGAAPTASGPSAEPAAANSNGPAPPEPASLNTPTPGPLTPTPFRNAVMVALHVMCNAMPLESYGRILNLIDICKGDVGRTCHDKKFAAVALQVAHDKVVTAQLNQLQRIMPGIGLPSFFELICDGGTIGKYYSRARDSVLVVAVNYSTSIYPYTDTMLLGLINEGDDGSVDASIAKIKQAARSMGLDATGFLKRLSVACGDGVYAAGGEHAKQKTTAFDGLAFWGELVSDAKQYYRSVWDFFHCFNKAIAATVRGSSRATALNVFLRDMECVFGLGQGRYLQRAVADCLDINCEAMKTPVASRQGTSLLQCPSRFLQKFRNLYCAMTVRQRQVALFNRSSKSLSCLNQIAEPLCDAGMLTFVLGTVACNDKVLAPFVAQTQDVSDLPSTRWRSRQRVLQKAGCHIRALERLRCLCVLHPLLAMHVGDSSTLLCWWAAHCFSAELRPLFHPKFHAPAQILEVFCKGTYKGCDLTIALPAPGPDAVLLSPHCQCCTRPQRVPGSIGLRLGGGLMSDPSLVHLRKERNDSGHGRAVMVPFWVSRSLYCGESLRQDAALANPETIGPRWQLADRSSRGSGHRACRVSRLTAEALRRVLVGLSDAIHYWRRFLVHFESYVGGTAGMNKLMRNAFAAMETAFPFQQILDDALPRVANEEAAWRLYRFFRQDLEKLPWPAAPFRQTPSVQIWPKKEDVFLNLYRKWWGNLHEAALRTETGYRERWRAEKSVLVKPLVAYPFVHDFWTHWSRARLGKRRVLAHVTAVVASRISSFLRDAPSISWPLVRHFCARKFLSCGGWASGACRVSVAASSKLLSRDSFRHTAAARYGRQCQCLRQGDFISIASLVHDFLRSADSAAFVLRKGSVKSVHTDLARVVSTAKTIRRRFVRVLGCRYECNEKAMAAACENDPAFSKGCYHMNVLFCFSRRMAGTEAPCERIIGQLKYLYHPVKGQSTGTMCAQLRCRLAGLRGDGLDGAVLQSVADDLYSSSKRRQQTTTLLERMRDVGSVANASRVATLASLASAIPRTIDLPRGWRKQRSWAKARRSVYEHAMLEHGDEAHLLKGTASGLVTLPLFLQNKIQWQKWHSGVGMTPKDKYETVEAQVWAKAAVRRMRPMDASDSESSSSSSSSSTGTAASEPGAGAVASEPGAGVEARAFDSDAGAARDGGEPAAEPIAWILLAGSFLFRWAWASNVRMYVFIRACIYLFIRNKMNVFPM